MYSLRVLRVVAITVTLGALGGCDNGPKFGPPDKFIKVGDNQIAAAGTAVPVAPAIIVVDLEGRGVPGIAVTFAIASGGGLIDSASTSTDKTGTAKVSSWTLGTGLGSNTLTVFASDVPGSPASFTAAAIAGPPTTLTKVGADPASAPAGGNIDSIVIRIADKYGNPVSGQTVNFAVTAGGGNVTPASRTTLGDGRAATRWQLGPVIDATNSMTATLATGGLSATFTTIAGRAIAGVRMAQHVLVVDSTASISPSATAVDFSGAPVPDAGITLLARNPSIASVGASSVTGLKTGQTFVVATSTDNQLARDSALLIVGNIAAPVVTLGVPRFDLKADTTFTASLVVDMRSAAMLGAATLNVTWDPAVLSFVSDQAGAANVLAVSNTSSSSAGFLSIAVASSDGVGGAVEVRKLTFKAATTTGKAGSVAVNVVDLTAASTFANLVPLTVSGSYPLRIR